MKTASQLGYEGMRLATQSATNGSQNSEQNAQFPEPSDVAVELIFRTFARRFTHKWAVNFADKTARNLWRRDLAAEKISDTEIKSALALPELVRMTWPPSTGEFIAFCRPPDARHKINAAAYRVSPRITDKSHLLSSDERECRREIVREGVGKMRDALEESEERAAIMEFDGGLSCDEAEQFASKPLPDPDSKSAEVEPAEDQLAKGKTVYVDGRKIFLSEKTLRWQADWQKRFGLPT